MRTPEFHLPDGVTWPMVDRYVVGEATSEDRTTVEAMLRADPDFAAVVTGLRRAGQVPAHFESQIAASILAKNERSFEDILSPLPSQATPVIRRGGGGELGRAPGLFAALRNRQIIAPLGFALAILLGVFVAGSRKTPITPVHGISQTYTTTAAQRATIPLADGSTAILSPNTILHVAPFGTSRTVVLAAGEAYFIVPHGTGAPFVVRSGTAMTRVLGTEFLVRHTTDPLGSHAGLRVAVASGKVQLTSGAHADTGVTLTMGQIGDVHDSTIHASSIGDLGPETERQSGQFVFRHTPVGAILETLTRWYGYQFRYADRTLADRGVTMVVSTQSSAEALAAIERVLAVNLTVVGDTVTLTPRRATSPGGALVRPYNVWTPTREVGR